MPNRPNSRNRVAVREFLKGICTGAIGACIVIVIAMYMGVL